MEPRIQYAKTKDGVNIAYSALGEGRRMVFMPPLPFSQDLAWQQLPGVRRWGERLTRKREVISYDPRGAGLSDRDVTDYSLDAQMLDLEAVVDRLELDTFALLGYGNSGPVAIAYAARHPERVSHLILWHAVARVSDQYHASRYRAMLGMREIGIDWDVYVETVVRLMGEQSEGEEELTAFMRESMTPESAWRALTAQADFDASGFLSQVRAPTLVLHRSRATLPIDLARNLASQIPHARLVLLEGTSTLAHIGDMESVAQAIDGFLGEEPAKEPVLPEGTAIILFADIADSTALTEQLGDAAFRAKATALDGLLRKLISDAGGTPVEGKVMGDGVMAVFASARQAIDCALRCKKAGDEGGLPLHLGIHAGDVIREGNTVYGGAVNLAQRVADACPAGEVFVSDTVRSLARTSTEVGFEDRGEHELKGIAEPQRLYEVRWRGEA